MMTEKSTADVMLKDDFQYYQMMAITVWVQHSD
jgi:hypothetical protein